MQMRGIGVWLWGVGVVIVVLLLRYRVVLLCGLLCVARNVVADEY